MLQNWMSLTENVWLFVFFANTAMFQRLSIAQSFPLTTRKDVDFFVSVLKLEL